jgi:hypothetical protein
MYPVARVSIKYWNNLRTQHSIFLVLDFIVHFSHYMFRPRLAYSTDLLINCYLILGGTSVVELLVCHLAQIQPVVTIAYAEITWNVTAVWDCEVITSPLVSICLKDELKCCRNVAVNISCTISCTFRFFFYDSAIFNFLGYVETPWNEKHGN